MNEPGAEPTILEAVPNFSEGHDERLLSAWAEDFSQAGCLVADVHADPDHHRSVFTVFGTGEQLIRGLEEAVERAVASLDLTSHSGVHPRVGVADVVPIVPMDDLHPQGGDSDEALAVSRELARRLGDSHGLPVLSYGLATDVAWAGSYRLGGRDRLEASLLDGSIVPSAGSSTLHATAGATIVGARPVLIAFNVVLDSDELATASFIAAQIRERGGGLAGVRALGLALNERGQVQVSTNVERWREVGPLQVLQAVEEHASAYDVEVLETELVGLAPAAALENLSDRVACRATAEPALETHLRRAVDRLSPRR